MNLAIDNGNANQSQSWLVEPTEAELLIIKGKLVAAEDDTAAELNCTACDCVCDCDCGGCYP
jgi:hypothetical protein